jgi:hypothetical protein
MIRLEGKVIKRQPKPGPLPLSTQWRGGWGVRSVFPLLILLLIGCTTASPTPPPPLPTCTPQQIAASLAAVGDYQSSPLTDFIEITGSGFTLNDEPYPVRGINYYPARYPWRRFLTETDTTALHTEFTLMRDAGFNTLRIFLWNEALFICPGSPAVPHPDHLQRLDTVIRLAADYDFRLIVTLNDMPDPTLYTNPPHVQQQTAFIITRYRDEAAIMAWDLRNEGDIDYGTHHAFPAIATREEVLDWLDTTAQQVRALDSRHLITAGWLYNPEDTIPYVDFISFHHWTPAADLPARLTPIRTTKPILLQEFGYSTQRLTPDQQARMISEVIAESQSLAGWMIWAAFDFPLDRSCYPSPCQSPDNQEHYFGLWTSDYTPKPALKMLRERF